MSGRGLLQTRLRPTAALIHDAVDATTWLVEEGHESTARWVIGALSLVPELRGPAKAADEARRLITGGVLGSVRLVNRAVQGVSDVALDLADLPPAPEPMVALHSEALVSPEGALDQLVGALNGAVGDHLAGSGNGLDLGMRLRLGDRWLPADPAGLRAALAGAGPKAVVLAHGLATTELSWSLDAERALGDAGRHYGGLLAEEQGFTPLYLRYNTGLTVAENGRRLAALLAAVAEAWPGELEALALIGHSMGGLVCRAATRVAAEAGDAWLERLTHLIGLGSPHQGAPLARLGHATTRVLRAVDLPATRIIGRILDHRSVGVKDLRDREMAACGPLLDHVTYLFVAGALTDDPDHPAVSVLGDMLVPVESASGPNGVNVAVQRFGGVAHHRLQAHPEVYRAVADALAGPRRCILNGGGEAALAPL